ncbi:hypothetical protein HA402_015348 [Bradysia odoriphaga]|nr:hypothetical protein HA402_015348 [Bradysia odoriphaga]
MAGNEINFVQNNAHTTSSDDSDTEYIAELRGYLSKWTNYIHGWQQRYIVLKNAQLSYYKSEQESELGCRGAISLYKAVIKTHEFDDCRFDVSVNNCVWYLRTESTEDRDNWIEVLQSYNTSNSNIIGASLRRHDSNVSLQSNTLSTSSLKRANRSLREKVNEIETFKDILYGQVETLQRYFDACAELNQKNGSTLDLGDGLKPIDFKGESITFRETTAGVLTTLQHCLDIIHQRDESWKKKFDREIERRRKTEDLYKKYKDELNQSQNSSFPGPDLEEGPHSTLPEDEFFDAVESGLDKIEEDRQLRARLRLQSQQSQISTASSVSKDTEENSSSQSDEFGTGGIARNHRLWPQIDEICTQQLHYARQGVGEGGNGWQLFADEGEMKMYRREQEIDGMVVDPLKACHFVKGVSAREMCHYFFMPEYRNDWETTLEDMTILEKVSPDTLVFLQTHKRIWPASQRDALFWSHMKNVKDNVDKDAHSTWIVCNHSIERDDYPPANTGKCVRIFLTVILVCQTYVAPIENGHKITRNDLSCKITYCSVVNPGGWAPASVLRAIYKKEYPKFLKRYTAYVVDQCKNKPIMF